MTVSAPAPSGDEVSRTDPAGSSGRNLLDYRPVRAVLTHRLYPGVLRLLVTAVFVLVGVQLLIGPDSEHDNLGTALMWVVWWPLLPIVVLLVGRFWCAVCPFATLNDWVQKFVGLERPVPSFLKKYGIWLINASFLALTWSDHVWGIEESPWGSGLLMLLFVTAVVVSGALWKRRTFCRYLCFVGGLSGSYARTSMVELRANSDICQSCDSRAACYHGSDTVAGCPLFSFPRAMDSAAHCNLCGNCLKNCSNDAIEVRPRKPLSELWLIRRARIDEAFLAVAVAGIVLIQNVTMLDVWTRLVDGLRTSTGISSYAVIFTIVFAAAVALPVVLLVVASRVAAYGNAEPVRVNFARFGYALIPLDVAGHVAHNLFHLLAEGKAVWLTALPLIGREPVPGASAALVGAGTIRLLQYIVLTLGIVGSLYTAFRISQSRYRGARRRRATFLPYAVLIAGLGAVNVVLFLLPMASRL